MTCKFCGSELFDNASFCTNCGAPISAQAEPPMEQPIPEAPLPMEDQSVPEYQTPQQSDGAPVAAVAAPPKRKNGLKIFLIILASFLALVVVVLGVCSVLLYQEYSRQEKTLLSVSQDYEAAKSELQQQDSTLAEQEKELLQLEEELAALEEEYDLLNMDYDYLADENDAMWDELYFYWDNVAIILDDDDRYHCYDCTAFEEADSFYMMNTVWAESEGYYPCPLCK